MTKALRKVIERLIRISDRDSLALDASMAIHLTALKEAYRENRATITVTSKRIEFLQECLETGVSKRAAARMLMAHDPRVGQKTAETLVYTNFSGQYQTTLRGRRTGKTANQSAPIPIVSTVDIEDDESLL